MEMDLFMPKNRILELYLNCIEWGKGIYGIGAASYHYYGTKRGEPFPGRASPSGNHHHQSGAVQRKHIPEEQADAGALRLSARRRFPDPQAEPTEPGRLLNCPTRQLSAAVRRARPPSPDATATSQPRRRSGHPASAPCQPTAASQMPVRRTGL